MSAAAAPISRRFAVAPMLDWTDRHCRYFLRLISRHALLYTEMVTTAAILHGDRAHHLGYDAFEHPLALQLGGSDPRELAACSAIATDYGYDEINLNVGCPSDRVQDGRFGACLMLEPERVGDCIAAMRARTPLPVTVKTRLGVDEHDSYEFLRRFIEVVSAAGCQTFILHARKAWLHGLSPKENREIPPLMYTRVYRIKQDYPHLEIIINGGITGLDQALDHLRHVDGVMLGREAYHNPYQLAEVDRLIYDDHHPIPSRAEIIQSYLPYIERQLRGGCRLNHLTRHILGLYQGVPGARAWRRHLSEHAHRPDAGIGLVTEALPQT